MKRLIFTMSLIIAAGLISTAYSQVSIHASINIGGAGIYVRHEPVYQPACPPPAPVYYDNNCDREHVNVVIGRPEERRYRDGDREYRDRDYRGRDYRDRDRRDFDHDRDHRGGW